MVNTKKRQHCRDFHMVKGSEGTEQAKEGWFRVQQMHVAFTTHHTTGQACGEAFKA
jgi:hypothetical protein